MSDTIRVSRPKGAIALKALGSDYAVWITQADMIGIVERRTGHMKRVSHVEWLDATKRRQFNAIAPSVAEMAALDMICGKLLQAPAVVPMR